MPKQSKSAIICKMLARPKGATLEAICVKSGWQRHTAHAFLSRLRKSGRKVAREGDGNTATYHLAVSEETSK